MLNRFNLKKSLMILTGLFLFEIATSWGRAFEVTIDLPIGFLKYLLLVWFLVSRKMLGTRQATIGFTVGLTSIYLFGILIDEKIPILALPNIFMELLGVWMGCLFANKNTGRKLKVGISSVVLAFSTWYIAFGGYDHYLNIVDGDGFDGRVSAKEVGYGWRVYNSKSDTFSTEYYKGKIAYLDFWSTSCGVCFVKFPELEQLYRQHKNNPSVVIQAVNIPIERDTAGMAFKMIERNNKYSFPVVIGTDSMREAFGVNAYPTVVILKDNKIVFRGRTELARQALEDISKQISH